MLILSFRNLRLLLTLASLVLSLSYNINRRDNVNTDKSTTQPHHSYTQTQSQLKLNNFHQQPQSIVSCPAGTFLNSVSNQCMPCPLGQASRIGSTACFNITGSGCPPGSSILRTPGRTPPEQCQPCPVNTFCVNGACATADVSDPQKGCNRCPPGTQASSEGSIACTSSRQSGCPPGSGQDSISRFGCYPCPKNTFNNNSSSPFCRACPSGLLQEPINKTSCIPVPCDAGYFRSNITSPCMPCADGTISYPGLISPRGCAPAPFRGVVCGPGTAPSHELPSCVTCRSGRYCRNGKCAACSLCPPDSTSTYPGAVVCSVGTRDLCPPGTGYPLSGAGCFNCTGNTFNSGSFGLCQTCPSGTLPNAQFTACTRRLCLAGEEYFDNEPPPPPQTSPMRNVSSKPAPSRNGTALPGCRPCPPGLASISAPAAKCENVSMTCTPGEMIQYSPFGSTCKPCPPNSYCRHGNCLVVGEQSGTDALNGCNKCPPQTGSSLSGATFCTRAINSRTNSSVQRTGQFRTFCPAGSGRRRLVSGCYRCSASTFNNGSSALCNPCPRHLISNENKTACVPPPCTAGYFRRSNALNSTCEECAPGTASLPGTVSATGCTPTPGRFCGRGTSPRTNECPLCFSGFFCPNGRCLTGCQTCIAPDRSTMPGATICVKDTSVMCPPGTGQVLGASLGCFNCTRNTYNDGRYVQCRDCPPGLFANADKTACLHPPCLPGYYNDTNGNKSMNCVSCPPGTASASGDRTCRVTNVNCGPGNFVIVASNTVPIKYRCEECSPNSYCLNGRCLQSNIGGTGASSSTPGAPLNLVGLGCIPCPERTGAASYGAVSCTPLGLQTTRSINLNVTCPLGTGVRKAYATGCYNCTGSKVNRGNQATCVKCNPSTVPDELRANCVNVCRPGTGFVPPKTRNSKSGDDDLPYSLCVPCPKSMYNAGNIWTCRRCLDTQYPNADRTACLQCTYPYVSHYFDENNYLPCNAMSPAIQFQATISQLLALAIFSFVLYIVSMGIVYIKFGNYSAHESEWARTQILGVFLLTLISVIDLISDVAFILTSEISSFEILMVFIAIFMFQYFFFFFRIWALGATVRFPIPIPSFFFFEEYDSLIKIAFTSFASIPWVIINAPFWLPWLLYGMFLFSSKLIVIGKVEAFWLYVWSGKDFPELDMKIDQKYTNLLIYAEILFESFPQVILQISNNKLLNDWSPINLASAALSIVNILSGFYQLIYTKIYLKRNLLEAPIDVTIINWNLLFIDNYRTSESDDGENQNQDSSSEGNPRKDPSPGKTNSENPSNGQIRKGGEMNASAVAEKRKSAKRNSLSLISNFHMIAAAQHRSSRRTSQTHPHGNRDNRNSFESNSVSIDQQGEGNNMQWTQSPLGSARLPSKSRQSFYDGSSSETPPPSSNHTLGDTISKAKMAIDKIKQSISEMSTLVHQPHAAMHGSFHDTIKSHLDLITKSLYSISFLTLSIPPTAGTSASSSVSTFLAHIQAQVQPIQELTSETEDLLRNNQSIRDHVELMQSIISKVVILDNKDADDRRTDQSLHPNTSTTTIKTNTITTSKTNLSSTNPTAIQKSTIATSPSLMNNQTHSSPSHSTSTSPPPTEGIARKSRLVTYR